MRRLSSAVKRLSSASATHLTLRTGLLPLTTVHRPLSALPQPPGAPATPRAPRLEGDSAPYTVQEVIGWLEDEHAFDLCFLDVKHLMDGAVGDWLLFASARSTGHMLRTAKAVRQEFKRREVTAPSPSGSATPSIEGQESDDWMLVDGGSVIVNIMCEAASHCPRAHCSPEACSRDDRAHASAQDAACSRVDEARRALAEARRPVLQARTS